MEKPTKRKSAKAPAEADNISSAIIQLGMMLLLLWMKIRILFSSIKALNKPLEITLPKSLAILLPPDLSAIRRAHIHKFSTSPNAAWQMGERLEISGRCKDGVGS